MNATERAKFGCLTFWENAEGVRCAIVRYGRPPEALLSAIEAVEQLDPTYSLVCYSTPETILRDLIGGMRSGARGRPTAVAMPERAALGRVHRMDKLHPRLRRADEYAYRKSE